MMLMVLVVLVVLVLLACADYTYACICVYMTYTSKHIAAICGMAVTPQVPVINLTCAVSHVLCAL